MQRKIVPGKRVHRPANAGYAACRGLAFYDRIEADELLDSCDLVREAMHRHDAARAYRSAE